MQDAHAKAVELREYLYHLGVGSRINYGGSYGFQAGHQAVAVNLNESASRLVGAIVNGKKAELEKLMHNLEGEIQIAASTTILGLPDAEKALGMLDAIRTLIK